MKHAYWVHCALLCCVLGMALPQRICAAETIVTDASTDTVTANEDSHLQAGLVHRICNALHTYPAQRKQQCGAGVAQDLSSMCESELGAALHSGSVSLSLAKVLRCEADSAQALQGCDWVGPLQPPPPASCTALINGSLAAGSECHSSLACSDGLYCRGVALGRNGICSVPAAQSSHCEIPADSLAIFTHNQDDQRHPSCDGSCVKGFCLAKVKEGGTCASTAMCQSGLHCMDGHCSTQSLRQLGQACSINAECGGGSVCQSGLCGMPKPAGAQCKLPFECRSMQCEKAEGAEQGVCTGVSAATAVLHLSQ